MEIKRVTEYNNPLFSQIVLNQRGAFLIDEEPYEIEIISNDSAFVRGKNRENFKKLIEYFRYYSPHINNFFDENNKKIISFEKKPVLTLEVDKIQPSQFYIDEDKVNALKSFIKNSKDIVIQVVKSDDGYICVDGHTRLFIAFLKNFKTVLAIETEFDDDTNYFVSQAKKRNIFTIKDLELVPHSDYKKLWNDFCDSYFNID
ncbi:ParB/RepB/Spo0J family partition protein [Parvimonas micra]|uniref:ParB/RepB/Spo0J family partition protein n=1 Tax=Parvimonas micra TaxID=33033 RepID=UPI0022B6A407|nr:ParB/RepB/Spo0J family partition protein [Parvimonas micra]WBB32410.1 ParB/RepB/Spo0J family partition protein [Parvimonas micra]